MILVDSKPRQAWGKPINPQLYQSAAHPSLLELTEKRNYSFFSTPSQQLRTVLWVEVIIMAYNGKSMTLMFFYGANEGGPGYQDTRKIPSWLRACCLNAGGGDFPETLFIHSSNASLYVRICKHWALGSFPLHKPRPTSSYVCCQEGRLVYCTEMPLALSIFVPFSCCCCISQPKGNLLTLFKMDKQNFFFSARLFLFCFQSWCLWWV